MDSSLSEQRISNNLKQPWKKEGIHFGSAKKQACARLYPIRFLEKLTHAYASRLTMAKELHELALRHEEIDASPTHHLHQLQLQTFGI